MKAALVSKHGYADAGVLWGSDRRRSSMKSMSGSGSTRAVEPSTGTGVFLLLPMVEGACSRSCSCQRLHKELGEGSVAVVLDNAPSHHSGEVHWPAEMSPLSLPPYSPELNPAEQIFRHLRKRLSNRIFLLPRRVPARSADRRTPAVLGASKRAAAPDGLSLVAPIFSF